MIYIQGSVPILQLGGRGGAFAPECLATGGGGWVHNNGVLHYCEYL